MHLRPDDRPQPVGANQGCALKKSSVSCRYPYAITQVVKLRHRDRLIELYVRKLSAGVEENIVQIDTMDRYVRLAKPVPETGIERDGGQLFA